MWSYAFRLQFNFFQHLNRQFVCSYCVIWRALFVGANSDDEEKMYEKLRKEFMKRWAIQFVYMVCVFVCIFTMCEYARWLAIHREIFPISLQEVEMCCTQTINWMKQRLDFNLWLPKRLSKGLSKRRLDRSFHQKRLVSICGFHLDFSVPRNEKVKRLQIRLTTNRKVRFNVHIGYENKNLWISESDVMITFLGIVFVKKVWILSAQYSRLHHLVALKKQRYSRNNPIKHQTRH